MKQVNEKHRVAGNSSMGNNGIFMYKHHKIVGYLYNCQVSDGLGWEHVSVTLQDHRNRRHPKAVKRCPTWEEMCFIKSLFFEDEEAVIQIHAPKSEWVSTHPYCLHLWRPRHEEILRPPAILVGVPGDNKQKL